MKSIVIDATNATLGRLASYAAKQALLGKNIIILNCSDAVISGNRHLIIKEYNEKRRRGGSSLKGPFFPAIPYKLVKRTIRGMLRYKEGRGRDALKRVMCYNNTPEEYKDVKKLMAGKEKRIKTIKLSDLAKEI